MLSNPLFWMELQFLGEKRQAELSRLMPVWKACRADLARADVQPIGDKPDGRSFPGFAISVDGKPAYLLLFREVTDRAATVVPVGDGEAWELLASNATVDWTLRDGAATVTFDRPRAYAFFKIG
jgi:alpha-galactosidase